MPTETIKTTLRNLPNGEDTSLNVRQTNEIGVNSHLSDTNNPRTSISL